jgi:hypothetical protein
MVSVRDVFCLIGVDKYDGKQMAVQLCGASHTKGTKHD